MCDLAESCRCWHNNNMFFSPYLQFLFLYLQGSPTTPPPYRYFNLSPRVGGTRLLCYVSASTRDRVVGGKPSPTTAEFRTSFRLEDTTVLILRECTAVFQKLSIHLSILFITILVFLLHSYRILIESTFSTIAILLYNSVVSTTLTSLMKSTFVRECS